MSICCQPHTKERCLVSVYVCIRVGFSCLPSTYAQQFNIVFSPLSFYDTASTALIRLSALRIRNEWTLGQTGHQFIRLSCCLWALSRYRKSGEITRSLLRCERSLHLRLHRRALDCSNQTRSTQGQKDVSHTQSIQDSPGQPSRFFTIATSTTFLFAKGGLSSPIQPCLRRSLAQTRQFKKNRPLTSVGRPI